MVNSEVRPVAALRHCPDSHRPGPAPNPGMYRYELRDPHLLDMLEHGHGVLPTRMVVLGHNALSIIKLQGGPRRPRIARVTFLIQIWLDVCVRCQFAVTMRLPDRFPVAFTQVCSKRRGPYGELSVFPSPRIACRSATASTTRRTPAFSILTECLPSTSPPIRPLTFIFPHPYGSNVRTANVHDDFPRPVLPAFHEIEIFLNILEDSSIDKGQCLVKRRKIAAT